MVGAECQSGPIDVIVHTPALTEQGQREAAFRDFGTRADEAEARNAGAYDRALLTLSSAALALSIAFGKDIVPFSRATHLWMLFSAWMLFVLTLVVNIGGFIFALTVVRQHKRLAGQVYREQSRTSDQLNARLKRDDVWQYRLNVIQGVLFMIGILSFSVYAVLNIEQETETNHESVTLSAQMKKSFPNSTYVPASTGNTSLPVQKPASVPPVPQVLPKK